MADSTDSDEKKRPDEAWRGSQVRLSIAVEAGGLGVFEWDIPSDRILWENDRMYEIFGRDPAEGPLARREFIEKVIEQDLESFDRVFRDAKPGQNLQATYRIRRQNDGDIRWIDFHGRFVSDAAGDRRLIGVLADVTEARRAREQITQSQLRLSLATNAGGFGVFEWDIPRDLAIFENHRCYEIFGRDPALGPINLVEFRDSIIHPDDLDGFLQELAATLQRGTGKSSLRIRRQNDRAIRWLEFFAVVTRREDDEPKGLIGIVVDITERKIVEEAAAQRLRLLDLSGEAILVRDANDVITYWNRGAEGVYGFTSAEALGKVSHELLETKFPESVELIKQKVERDGYWEGELRHRHKNGSWLSTESRWTAERGPTGKVRTILESNNDVTLARNADKLRRRMAAMVEASEDAIISKDLQSTIVTWNPASERIFGYKAEEAIGRSILSVVPPELHDFMHDEIERVARGERIEHYETTGLRKDGTRVPLAVSVSPIRDEDGRVIGAARIARDISDRREVEAERDRLLMREQIARAQAEEASRLKDDFLAVVSHELRAPLSTIAGWAHLLNLGKLDDTGRIRAAEAIQRATEAQTQLINDLLDVSRIVAGKMRLNVRPLKLYEVIDQAVESVKAAADAKRIKLQVISDPDAAPLSGDPDRLQQVFWNLLSNAIKFTSSGGRVELRSERINSHVEVTVSDTGIGISREMLPHVFDRFRQAESASNRKFGGLGLGLAIVRHLIELHGGTVTADSGGEGKGASFTVRLPTMVARREAYEGSQVHPAAGGSFFIDELPSLAGVRVLAIDDEPDAREVILEILRHAEAEVRTASSGQEALDTLTEWQPDVIVSDVGMPVMDGYALMREIRTRFPDRTRAMRSLALTAYSRTEDRLRAFSAGYQMHLPKPVEPIELLTVIATLARQS